MIAIDHALYRTLEALVICSYRQRLLARRNEKGLHHNTACRATRLVRAERAAGSERAERRSKGLRICNLLIVRPKVTMIVVKAIYPIVRRSAYRESATGVDAAPAGRGNPAGKLPSVPALVIG